MKNSDTLDQMGVAAVLLFALLSPSGGGLHAQFDGVQTGDLPAITVDRPMAALQLDGTVVPPDAPRWGPRRASVDSFGGWTRVQEASSAITLMFAGTDARGESAMLGVYDANQMRLSIWREDRLSGAPEFEHTMRREEGGTFTVDILQGTSLQRDDYAYRPRAGTVLPGCFVFLCQRARRVETPEDGLQWLAEGVSIVALDKHQGNWSIRLIGDVAPIGGDDRVLGRERICFSSMVNYFPAEDGVRGGRLVDAWIPFVDYMLHVPVPATAGQCMLLRARRAELGEARWRFEGPVLLHEFDGGVKRHTHAAAWTPGGVLLAIGDSGESEVALITHDGDGPWTDSSNWTVHHDIHGAPLAKGEGGDVSANQFWSVAPGPDVHTVICGGDNVSGAIMSAVIPSDPSLGVQFKRLWGVQPGDIGDGGDAQCTCSILQRIRQEHGGPLLARFYLESSNTTASDARLLLSDDCETFATAAGLRISGTKLSPAALLDLSIVTTPLGSQVDQGIYSMKLPTITTGRPLCVGPASVNQLHQPKAQGVLDLVAASGASVTEISRTGGGELSALAAQAPGIGPVWRLSREAPGDGDIAIMTLPTPEGGWPEGPLWAQLWMNNLTAGMLRPDVRVDLGPFDVRRRVAIASERQWVPFDLVTEQHDQTQGASPDLIMSLPVAAGPSPPLDMLVTIDSLTLSAAPPWRAAAPTAERPVERIRLPLPSEAPPWTFEADLLIPETGVDRGLGNRVPWAPLLTLALNDGTFLEVTAEPLYSRVYLDRIEVDGTRVNVMTEVGVRMARLDTLRVRIGAVVGGIGMDVVSGGRTRDFGRMRGTYASTLAPLVHMQLGDAQGVVHTPLELMRISLWPGEADVDVGIDDYSGPLFCEADLDHDGVVGVTDILILLVWWGDCPDGDDAVCPADLTDDGLVDIHDLLLILIGIGDCS